MLDVSRVQKELVECKRDKDISGVNIEINGDDLASLWYDHRSDIDALRGRNVSDQRPFAWHPNISSQNGAICLDILKDQWSPALTLKTALLSLQALLSAPEPDDPQDAVVAQQYLRDYPTFAATARYWTETFAKRASIGTEEKVQKLVEMGFLESLVRSTLEIVGGDENMALEKLCSG